MNPTRSAQGRPIGLMAAWLEAGNELALGSAEEHKNQFFVMSLSRQVRQAARQRLRAMPGGVGLLSCERLPSAGEGSEPEQPP